MKARVIYISLAVIIAVAALFIFLASRDSFNPDTFDLSRIKDGSPADQKAALEQYLGHGRLPADREVTMLAWAFANHPDESEELVRGHSQKIANLPRHLSDASLELIKQGASEAGLRALALARELYPNDPDVLGISGIIAYLGGKPIEARKFLEEAETWRQNRPIIHFYLGGILVQSDSVADRSRGKSLLMRVVTSKEKELSELAGLTLLGNSSIPMIREDFTRVYETLESADVFRPENPNLSANILRVFVDRLVAHLPSESIELADLLMTYPDTSEQDFLGIIQLSQALGQPDKAREYLEKVENSSAFKEGSDASRRLRRLQAAQLFLEEKYADGIEAFAEIASEQPEEPALQAMFNTVLQYDLPLDTESEILQIYLGLPVANITNSLNVLSRLIEIDPLHEDRWLGYAVDKLLLEDPVRVGQWLITNKAPERVIARFQEKDTPLTGNEYMMLANAYLEDENPQAAQKTLDEAGNLIDKDIVAFIHARILQQSGKPEEAFEYWQLAHQGAMSGETFPMLKNLGFLALQLNQNVSALQSLFTAFAAGIKFTTPEARELLNLTLRYGTLQQSIEVAEYLADQNPGNGTHRNNLAYFKFLAEQDVENQLQIMRELVESAPDVHEYRLTLALGLLKAGRTNEADRLLQSTDINWAETGTRGKMIYAVVLAATDKRVVADGLVQNLNMDELIPEEQALLEAF